MVGRQPGGCPAASLAGITRILCSDQVETRDVLADVVDVFHDFVRAFFVPFDRSKVSPYASLGKDRNTPVQVRQFFRIIPVFWLQVFNNQHFRRNEIRPATGRNGRFRQAQGGAGTGQGSKKAGFFCPENKEEPPRSGMAPLST